MQVIQPPLSTNKANKYHILNYGQIDKLDTFMKSRICIAPQQPKLQQHGEQSTDQTTYHDNGIFEILEKSCAKPSDLIKRRHHQQQEHESLSKCPKRKRNTTTLPLIHVKLRTLIRDIRSALVEEGIMIRDIRLNGGAAAYILRDLSKTSFNDVDIIFNIDLTDGKTFNRLKTLVIEAILAILQRSINSGHFSPQIERHPDSENVREDDQHSESHEILISQTNVKQYIRKMVRINRPGEVNTDAWSLLSLGHPTVDGGQTVELKFVYLMRRQYEFSVDSFQVNLDTLLNFYEKNGSYEGDDVSVINNNNNSRQHQPLTEDFHPIIVAESVCGDFKMALSHLDEKIIYTERPEEIRGGGLLKYCKLLVKGFRPLASSNIHLLERYMCSRFFIDFPYLSLQYAKLTSYLKEHFSETDCDKIYYLQILYEVVSNSTVCLMTHEYQQTLILIASLVQHVFCSLSENLSKLNLREFSNSNYWAIDKIHYGTSHFPKGINGGHLFAYSWLNSGGTSCPLRLQLNHWKTTKTLRQPDGKMPRQRHREQPSQHHQQQQKKKKKRHLSSSCSDKSYATTTSDTTTMVIPELFSEVEFPRLVNPI